MCVCVCVCVWGGGGVYEPSVGETISMTLLFVGWGRGAGRGGAVSRRGGNNPLAVIY